MSDPDEDWSQSVDDNYEAHGLKAVYTDEHGLKTDVLVIPQYDVSEYGDVVKVAARSVLLSVRTNQLERMPKADESFYLTKSCRKLRIYAPVDGTEYEHKVLAK